MSMSLETLTDKIGEEEKYKFGEIEITIHPKKASFIEPKIDFLNLPNLTGSEKQIAWAEELRKEQLISILRVYFHNFRYDILSYPDYKNETEKIVQMDEEFKIFFLEYVNKIDSKFWINNRNSNLVDYFTFQKKFRHIFKEDCAVAPHFRDN